jgi:hypothetical protein
MSALPHGSRPGPRSPLVARATAWLLDPPLRDRPPPLAIAPAAVPPLEPPRPLAAVVGLAPRAGTSTIARALAARLAALDPSGAAILLTPDPPRAPVATPAAIRLARALAALGIEHARAAGRLCLVPESEPLAALARKRSAPLVADIGHGTPAEGNTALADQVVLVCPPDVEPALASAVEAALRAGDHAVALVVNRATEEPPEALAHALLVAESRLSAQLTLACREPWGALAGIAAELAARATAEARR